MTKGAAGSGMEFQQGEVSVALDADPAIVLECVERVWGRILTTLDTVQPEQWEHPTRCTEWRLVDIVNHLCDTAAWIMHIVDAHAEGRESHIFDNFEPRGVPKRLTDAADRDPAVARPRLDESLRQLRKRLGVIAAEGNDISVETPLGKQPGNVGLLHYFWDLWLHERDMFLPLGRDVPELADEVLLAAIYSLRIEGYVQAAFGREVSVGLVLDGGVDGTVVLETQKNSLRAYVVSDGAGPDRALHGDAATVVDALCGRGQLAAALHGPDEVRADVSMLRTVLAGA